MDFGFRDWEETRELKRVERFYDETWEQSPRKTRRKKKKSRRLLGALLAILLVLALMIAGFLLAGGHLRAPGGQSLGPGSAQASENVVPLLLLGTDQRTPQDPARADTIMLAFLDLKEKTVCFLSVPRDTLVHLPGRKGEDKINASHALGGAEGTARAVSDLLEIDVRYYVETNFEGFTKIVDTLGGVTIDVKQDMNKSEEGINLQKGVQRLNGHDALSFVRYREYPTADIERIKQQQVFFSALIDETLQMRNILKISALVRNLKSAVNTNLGTGYIIELANIFRSIDNSRVKGYTLPGDHQYVKEISYWVPRYDEINALVEALMKETAPPGDPEKEPRVSQ